MKILKSKIRKLIRQVLLEIKTMPTHEESAPVLKLPMADDIQKDAYDKLISGMSLTDIFPGHDREALKDKVKRLYTYIKEKQLPVPKRIADRHGFIGSHARAEEETVSLNYILKELEEFSKDLNKFKLNQKHVDYFLKQFNSNKVSMFVPGNTASAIKDEVSKLSSDKLVNEANSVLKSIAIYFRNDIKNKQSNLIKNIREKYKKYKKGEIGIHEAVCEDLVREYYSLSFNDISDINHYFNNLGYDMMISFITSYNLVKDVGMKSLYARLSEIREKVKKQTIEKRIPKQRKVMTQLKDLSTSQIKSDTTNWFAIHYVGAFSSHKGNDNYIAEQASFLKEFGGPGGISADEYAAVPYPKTAKKQNDLIAAGSASNLGGGYPKIGMVLNGTITGIFYDDVHSDTFRGSAAGSGIGGSFDPEEGFVRFPGGEQMHDKSKAASKFKQHDKTIFDLEKAEKEIANSDVYPGKKGYYECFVDDWYVEGIVCDWQRFRDEYSPYFDGPKDIFPIFDFLEVIKEKNIKIYDQNFDNKLISYDDLCDIFSFILNRFGIMKYQKNPDGSITAPLDGFKLPMSKPDSKNKAKAIQEAVFDYKSSLDKRANSFKNLDLDVQQDINRFLNSDDVQTAAQGHELIDTFTEYERSGIDDIEDLKRFSLGQMYNMIPGLEDMGRSSNDDYVNYHDKLVQLLQSDTVEMFLLVHNLDDAQEKRIASTGIVKPEDVDNLYIYSLHASPTIGMTQDILFNGLQAQAGGTNTYPYEKAIINYIIQHAKHYEVQIL